MFDCANAATRRIADVAEQEHASLFVDWDGDENYGEEFVDCGLGQLPLNVWNENFDTESDFMYATVAAQLYEGLIEL